jgi:signal transduction histidine kinase
VIRQTPRWLSAALASAGVAALAARAQRQARRYAQLADEQAALQRVATLVARGVPRSELFTAVARELGLLLGVDATHMARYDPDGTATGIAAWSPGGPQFPIGTRINLEGDSVAGRVFRSGRPARMEGYERAKGAAGVLGRQLGLREAVGAPIVVEQRVWGVMIASSLTERSLPPDTESRIAAFTDLVATAIANAESRADLARLAEEQAALRRVATLVARGAPPDELFAAVVNEAAQVVPVEFVAMARYEDDDTLTTLATSDGVGDLFPVGRRWPLGGENVTTMVARTGRSARLDSYTDASSPLTAAIQQRGLRSSVATPIVVEGRVWGVMAASQSEKEPLPADTEARLASFTELVGTAISNSEARTQLDASRKRIIEAADHERRRVVRDLQDGTQQRLVQTVLTLKLAQRAAHENDPDVPSLVGEALESAERATADLRELTHGILPAVLTRGGLGAAVETLASRAPAPVDLDVSVSRLPAPVEATAYLVVAEALTNIAKHAHAEHVAISARVDDRMLGVRVSDDGVGGARVDGTGLVGLADRLAALDGWLRVADGPEGGTLLEAFIPVEEEAR